MTREEADKESDLWGVNNPETMSASTPNEAIGDYLEACSPLPETVTLQAFKRMQPVEGNCGFPLRDMLERLDEDFGDPEGATKESPDMVAAEREFIAKILGLYKSWSCEEIYSEEVNVREWCERTGNTQLMEESR